MVPADSRRISRVPRYSGAGLARGLGFRVRGSHPLRPTFPGRSTIPATSLCRPALQPRHRRDGTGLGSSAFARHYLRNHCYFLFLRVMRCFSSPGSPSTLGGVPESPPAGCPIRKSAANRVFAPDRGLSQLVTSFLASESQGILHVPLSPFLRFSCNDTDLIHLYQDCIRSLDLDEFRFLFLLVYPIRVCGRVSALPVCQCPLSCAGSVSRLGGE